MSAVVGKSRSVGCSPPSWLLVICNFEYGPKSGVFVELASPSPEVLINRTEVAQTMVSVSDLTEDVAVVARTTSTDEAKPTSKRDEPA